MTMYVVIMSCRYEGIQELFKTAYRDRSRAEAAAYDAKVKYIANRIDGIRASLDYCDDPGLIAAIGAERAAAMKERDIAELARWERGEYDRDEDGRVESYAWRVIEMQEDA